ncbi:hypothetical protein [Streptomyces violaceusniger]|uniref:hypothetical protein n=1 Tax=Streptomyces violaceusniger TaxID=68280 RepID=UPI0013876197
MVRRILISHFLTQLGPGDPPGLPSLSDLALRQREVMILVVHDLSDQHPPGFRGKRSAQLTSLRPLAKQGSAAQGFGHLYQVDGAWGEEPPPLVWADEGVTLVTRPAHAAGPVTAGRPG